MLISNGLLLGTTLFANAWLPPLSSRWTRLTASAISLGYWEKKYQHKGPYMWWRTVGRRIHLWIFREGYVPERQKSHLYRSTIEIPLWTRAGWPTSLQYGFKCDMNLLDVCLEPESSKSDGQLSISCVSREISLRELHGFSDTCIFHF